MSVACGVECVVVLGCLRWAWKRCTYIGSYDSAAWPDATADEFDPIPRVCRVILAVYEPDLSSPKYAPAGGYRLNPDWVVKRVTYEQTLGHAPPYLIYLDHDHREIVLAIRGLNLAKESDYKLLLDNRLGKQMFDGGYVHHGLLKSAIWVLKSESGTLKNLWEENGRDYRMVFAGHSLGSGVAALMSVIVANHGDELGGIPRGLVRCYAVAPARCMSLNLAVKYADIICSVVLQVSQFYVVIISFLFPIHHFPMFWTFVAAITQEVTVQSQDDFLARTATPLEDIFRSIFCLPCLLFLVCLRDTFIPEDRKLRDPRRLYAPGRMYHIVERKFCRCGRYPPEVKTAIPVDGRFEHIVLSCNATSDHAIIWIEREAETALENLKELSTITTPPEVQRLDRKQTLEKEHNDALERAVTLNIPYAVKSAEKNSYADTQEGSSGMHSSGKDGRTNWDEVVEKLFKRSESGKLLLKGNAA
ncbi:calmodulin-binding heat-shock protein [Striga asiatica]|uniref:Calmodulin-binding heat-shock protein n=1 Tax=Striga asiatica TaxID=4170 RepID=A0A5A7PRG3_STRAF|nr:calmodulin-binding heat-shock protein [Striga asiatica]